MTANLLPPEDDLLDELARRHLIDFTAVTFVDGDQYDVNWHHEVTAEHLEEWAFGDIDRLILTLPPQHGKTTLASRHLPAWILGRDPDGRIIATSYAADLATSISRDVKRVINGDRYRRIFPDTRISERRVATDEHGDAINRADEWEIVGRRGRYIARGVDGAITGRGARWLLVDDPFKDAEEARSPTYRARAWRWLNQVLKTRGAAGYKMLIIMTRWHEDDIVGRLLEDARTKPDADQWIVVNLPAIAEPERAPYDPREVGEALWPEFKDAAHWRSFKAVDPQGYAALGQQRPTPEGGTIVKERWLTDHLWQVMPTPRGARIIVVGDLKAGARGRGSHAVLQLWMQPAAERARAYILDQVRGQWDSVETEAVFLLHAGQPYDHLDIPPEMRAELAEMTAAPTMGLWSLAKEWHVEDKADGRATVRGLRTRIPGLLLWSGKGRGKEDRLRSVVPFMAAGNVRAPERAPWLDEWVYELTHFPAAASDDQVDTTSMALDILLVPDTVSQTSPYEGWFTGDDLAF